MSRYSEKQGVTLSKAQYDRLLASAKANKPAALTLSQGANTGPHMLALTPAQRRKILAPGKQTINLSAAQLAHWLESSSGQSGSGIFEDLERAFSDAGEWVVGTAAPAVGNFLTQPEVKNIIRPLVTAAAGAGGTALGAAVGGPAGAAAGGPAASGLAAQFLKQIGYGVRQGRGKQAGMVTLTMPIAEAEKLMEVIDTNMYYLSGGSFKSLG